MTRKYIKYEVNRLKTLPDSTLNRNKIFKLLKRLNKINNTELTIDDKVIDSACIVFEVTREQLDSKSRKGNIPDAKKVMANYFHHVVGYPYRYIGFLLSFQRASAYHSAQSLDPLMQFDKQLRDKWEQFKELLQEKQAA